MRCVTYFLKWIYAEIDSVKFASRRSALIRSQNLHLEKVVAFELAESFELAVVRKISFGEKQPMCLSPWNTEDEPLLGFYFFFRMDQCWIGRDWNYPLCWEISLRIFSLRPKGIFPRRGWLEFFLLLRRRGFSIQWSVQPNEKMNSRVQIDIWSVNRVSTMTDNGGGIGGFFQQFNSCFSQ